MARSYAALTRVVGADFSREAGCALAIWVGGDPPPFRVKRESEQT